MANTTFQGPVTSKAGFITTGPANVVDADSSISLTVASHSGKIVHNDAAGAVTYTLPATNANADSAVAGPGADLNNLSNVGAKFTIVNNQEAFTHDKATQIGTDMLIANPEINLMYAANEGGTAGAVNAVIAADQVGKTYVMGTDTTTELVEMVQQGDVLLAVNSQFPQEMGAGAMEYAIKAINGEEIGEFTQLIPTKVYTSLDKFATAKWLVDHADGIP